ncbi:acyltransferase family protein [Nocardioides aurantiacus]|uniref:Peptidoglycan/LPS O-acetylase OafA/YrhL n=1 Tax=Nocardioides aurantiacus TaxID=86796 RepID=A0A3N2CV39_9ACTN|nr:acyltransferase [Nocardioides aurantiacus]ROR91410.1 peptidoglycan/LPS O-acetylase OafA/YrhL [Nocardioides aurantiacus]
MAPTVTDPGPAPATPAAPGPDFPALDSLRAVASVAVVATHASFWAGAYAAPVWGTALARLDVGVALFFVLSGFLLSRPWFARRRAGAPPPGTGRYLWKRALRILPVYLLTVVAALTLLPGNRDAGPGQWLASLLLADTYVDDRLPDGLTQMWSLATEVAFYAVLPALMWCTLRPRRDRSGDARRFVVLVLAMLGVTVVWLLDLSVRLDGGGTMLRLWLPSYLTWFGTGLVLAAAQVARSDRGGPAAPDVLGGGGRLGRAAWGLEQLGRSPVTCWVAALALLAVASTPVAGPADLSPATLGSALTKNLLYAAVAGLVVLAGVFAPAGHPLTRLLSLRPLRHLGHLSYGLFCVHLVVLELVARWRGIELFGGRGPELLVLTLVVSLAVSELLYRLVERPLMRWKDLGRRTPPSSAATTTPSATATSSAGATSTPAHPSGDPSGRRQ